MSDINYLDLIAEFLNAFINAASKLNVVVFASLCQNFGFVNYL